MKTLTLAIALIATAAPAMAQSTTQRDAPTTNFYDARGNKTGSASTYGNTTKLYAPDGRLVGSANRNSGRR